MLRQLSAILSLVVVVVIFYSAEAHSETELLRTKRDTSNWARQSFDSQLLQDFGNGTTNNGNATVWKRCICDRENCDCHTEYSDFNNTKLFFRVEHYKSHVRFRVHFYNTNRTVDQKFILVNGTSCFQFKGHTFDQVCFMRYGSENNTFLDKACVAVGVRIQTYSSVAADMECVKHMSDGTTHVGPLNITQPDLFFLANYTLYDKEYVQLMSDENTQVGQLNTTEPDLFFTDVASYNTMSYILLLISTSTAILISKISS